MGTPFATVERFRAEIDGSSYARLDDAERDEARLLYAAARKASVLSGTDPTEEQDAFHAMLLDARVPDHLATSISDRFLRQCVVVPALGRQQEFEGLRKPPPDLAPGEAVEFAQRSTFSKMLPRARRNLLGLVNPDALGLALHQVIMDGYRSAPACTPDATGLKCLHKHLFGKVFPDAGVWRTSRDYSSGPDVTPPFEMAKRLDALLAPLSSSAAVRGSPLDDFARRAADMACAVTVLDPFAYGTKPLVRLMLFSLAKERGIRLDLANLPALGASPIPGAGQIGPAVLVTEIVAAAMASRPQG